MRDRAPVGLLDTSVVIDLEQLRSDQLPTRIAVSVVTMVELSAGPAPASRGGIRSVAVRR